MRRVAWWERRVPPRISFPRRGGARVPFPLKFRRNLSIGGMGVGVSQREGWQDIARGRVGAGWWDASPESVTRQVCAVVNVLIYE